MNIREFIEARIAEETKAADACPPWPWKPNAEHDEVLSAAGTPVCEGFALSGRQLRAVVDHVVRYEPGRVLHEVAAKRRVLERHCPYDGTALFDYCAGCPTGDETGYPDTELKECPELQDIAFIWNEHEDWDQEWCPHVEGRHEVEVPPSRRDCYTNACNRCGQGDGWHYRDRTTT